MTVQETIIELKKIRCLSEKIRDSIINSFNYEIDCIRTKIEVKEGEKEKIKSKLTKRYKNINNKIIKLKKSLEDKEAKFIELKAPNIDVFPTLHELMACNNSCKSPYWDVDEYKNFIKVFNAHNNKVLVFGLNPSNPKDETNQIENFAQVSNNYRKLRNVDCFDKFTYNDYFGKLSEIIDKSDLLRDFSPYLSWWTFKLNLRQRKKICYNVVQPNNNNTLIIFSDLIPWRETDANIVKKILEKNNLLTNEIVNLFKLQIELINPSRIIVANAFSADIINDGVSSKQYELVGSTHFKKLKMKNCNKEIPIHFSGMITSGRLDKYSLSRLKEEIKNDL